MQCVRCQHENRASARFCEACGSVLALACPTCGNLARPEATFCDHCGTRLSGQAPALGPAPPVQPRVSEAAPTAADTPPVARPNAPAAERRQLTVLFCDLVDSTALSEHLDPEELRDVVRAYQAVCAEVIGRFEGHIAQYLGDGLLVYFGYPQAHEDDAQRAVHAGMGIVEALAYLNTRLEQERGLRLAVRLGIHTGLVVVGTVGGGDRQEQLAMGDTPNIAARVQGLAAPDTVLISAATARLVEGVVTCQELGAHSLKGVSQPLALYRVLHEREAQSCLDAAVPMGLTPLVGREQEVELLLERWAQVKDGLGQVVLLSGEAGIGKSRLVQMLKERVADEPHTRLECRCSPYHQHSALYPIIDLWQRALRLQRHDTPDAKLQKLEATLAPYNVSLPEVVPLFASLLSIELDDRYPPLTMSPERQRHKTLEAVLTLLLVPAAQQPVLFIVEDLHWVDPSTLELLSLLVDQGPTARLCILLTCRPEFQSPWGLRTHLAPIMLNRLSRSQVERIAERVAGGKALPLEVRQELVTKTDGIPLFVEELTKMVLESGWLQERGDHYELTGPLPPLAIPTTLHDSLMARLDRLTTAKAVAQLGATLGRTFPYELLRAVSPLDEATLQHALRQLVDAELVYQRGLPPQATYLFKHALIQEAAYQSLLKSTRQQYHRHIAQVLAAHFPEMVETQPELLAYHYTAAGLAGPAIPHWQRAGERAIERSANMEAIGHFTKGLELLKTLPDTPERTQQEIALHIALGVPLIAIKGYGAVEVEQTYIRARELCWQVGETPQLFLVLRGLWNGYLLRAELQTARELGEQILTFAQRQQDPALLVEAHRVMGTTLSFQGEFAPARTYAEQGIALYDRQQHRALAFLYGADPGVICRLYAAWALCLLGYPDQALQRSHETLTLAQELSHPFSLAFALTYTAWLHQFRREGHAAQQRAEATITLSTEHGFAQWLARGISLRGWALAEQGQWAEGVAQIHQGMTSHLATRGELVWPWHCALLAEVHAQVGHVEEGLRVLAEALAAVDKTGERFYAAELHRLKGELLLRQAVPDAPQAEACFHQALAIARRQQAKSLELRTALSLSRLWQRQSKCTEARQLLAEVYGWFTEGFDTVDLQEAKALLDVLS